MEIGGVYSIEVTYNRERRDWHPHLHILFDAPFRLSMSPTAFKRLNRRIEFAWLKVTSLSARAKYATGPNGWVKETGKKRRRLTLAERRESVFQTWLDESKTWESGNPLNRSDRRIIKLKPVTQGDGAVYEVIKYISKTTRFLDHPEAVETYLKAVRGVRVTQTFGAFYNIKFDEGDEPAPLTYLKCGCGQNDFHDLGLFGLSSVYQAENGCWYLRQRHDKTRRVCWRSEV